MATLKLEDLLDTPTGQRMVAEHESAQAENEAQADGRRQAALADALEELHVTASAYGALRPEVLPMLEELALHVGRLLELRNRLRELSNLVRKHGGEVPAGFPVTMMGSNEFKAAVAQAREVMGTIGGAL